MKSPIQLIAIFCVWLVLILGCHSTGNKNLKFAPPQEDKTVQIKSDKFSGQSVYTVGPLLVSFDEQTDEPLLMSFNIYFTEGNKKPVKTAILFGAKTVDVGQKKYQRGDFVYVLADSERVIAEQIQMHKDETAYWGSIDRLQGFTIDTSRQVLQKLATSSRIEFRVGPTEFALKQEHQEALRSLLERVQTDKGK